MWLHFDNSFLARCLTVRAAHLTKIPFRIHTEYRAVPTKLSKGKKRFRWVSMIDYRRIERDHRSVGTPLSFDDYQSSKLISIEMAILQFRLNSNMLENFLSMGIFCNYNWSKWAVGTLNFNRFRWFFDNLNFFCNLIVYSLRLHNL